VVTSLIVMDGRGGVTEHVGGFSDWEAQGGRLRDPGESVETLKKPKRELLAANSGDKKVRKLSFKEQRELDDLPVVIEELEIRQAALAERMSRPGFYQGGAEEIEKISGELHDVQELLEAAFKRWDELEGAA